MSSDNDDSDNFGGFNTLVKSMDDAAIKKEPVVTQPVEKEKETPDESFEGVIKSLRNNASDLSDVVTLLIGDVDNIEDNIAERYKDITDAQLLKLTKDKDHFFNKLLRTRNTNTERERLCNLQYKTSTDKGHVYDVVTEGPAAASNKTTFKTGNGTLSGNAAKLAILSKTTGIKKNPLLNSGFYVIYKPLLLDDLHNIYTCIDEALQDYGRIYSAHALLMGSIIVEEAIMKAIHSAIVDSNLVGYEEYDTFLENVHVCDYDTLLWGLVTLMYPKGVNVTQICASKDCVHEDQFDVDINKLRLDNLDLITPEDIAAIEAASRTPEELKLYRKRVFKSGLYDIQSGLKVTFSPPTMKKRLDCGIDIVKNIVKKLKANKRYKSSELIKINTSKMIKPWIENVLIVDDAGNIENVIEDYDAISETIGITLLESQSLYDNLVEYSASGRTTFIGHRPKKCPVCNEVGSDKNYLQIGDVQTFFFISVRQLLILMEYRSL